MFKLLIISKLNSIIIELKFNILEEPEKVAFPSVAFKVASWFWKNNAYVIKSADKAKKSNLNELADGTFIKLFNL